MNMETRYVKLCDVITNGYLEGVYSDDNMSVFCFLKTVWVGFLHEETRKELSENTNPVGILLTETEANVIIQSKSCSALRFLQSQDASCLVFTEKTTALCHSALGRWRLKRQIKKRYYYRAKAGKKTADLPEIIDKSAAYEAICRACKERRACISRRKSNLKTVKILGFIALGCALLSLLHPLTTDLREQWNSDRSAEAFDKHGESGIYACVEADLLAQVATVESNGVSVRYYLYGNLEKGTYGVARFSELYEEYILLGEEGKTAVFQEPLLLYGLTREMPACVAELPEEPSDQQESIEVDSSKEAMAFFDAYGIPVGEDWELGSIYLESSMKPERDEAGINQFLDTLWIIMLLATFVLLVPLSRYGSRADYEEVIIQRINRGETMLLFLSEALSQQPEERNAVPELDG